MAEAGIAVIAPRLAKLLTVTLLMLVMLEAWPTLTCRT
jgi:hypothetical protein